MYEIYIRLKTMNKIFSHCTSSSLEVIGFLIGNVKKCGNCENCTRQRNEYQGTSQRCPDYHTNYTEIVDSFPAKSISTHTSVHFHPDAMKEIGGILSSSQYQNNFLIGWYHSHPGFGLFMSGIDVDTQMNYFRQPYNVACVVDPVNDEQIFYKLDLDTHQFHSVPYCVW